MIDIAISYVAERVNQQLQRSFDISEDLVVVSNILEQDGSITTHANNKIVVSLVNIEKENHSSNHSATVASSMPSYDNNPQMNINLYLMFASNFSGSNYQEGLKFLSDTISFLQRHPVFDQQNSPGLDRGISKLHLDIENLDMNELNNLWRILSGKYLPSILYKVRMITVDSEIIQAQTPVVSQPNRP